MSSPVNSARTEPPPIHWFWLAALLAFVKLVLYVLDSNPQVFLGDSMSYLVTALLEWIPPDRSFVYGYIVYGLTTRARSLSSLVAVQTVAGIATSMLTAVILVRHLRVSFAVAAALAIAVAIEPQQLLYERFVLTESLSTAVFTVYLLLALEYLRSRKLWLLVVLQAVGFLLVAFRVSFVPLLAVVTVAAPLFASELWGSSRQQAKQWFVRTGIHLLVSVGLFLGLHSAYKEWNGSLSKLPPAYTYADGFFLLSNVSPLVTPADTDDPQIAAVLATPLRYGAKPEEFNSRNSEMFGEDGLIARLRNVVKDEYRTNGEAKSIAYRAIRRDPVGFIRLAMQTHHKYYSKEYMVNVLSAESGMRELGPDELKILSHYHLDGNGLPFMKNLTRQYFVGVWPYYILLANTPLVMAAALALTRKGTRKIMAFVFVVTTIHLTAVQVLGVEPSPRHLHAAVVPLAVSAGILLSRLSRRS
jgi:hypothetical protein